MTTSAKELSEKLEAFEKIRIVVLVNLHTLLQISTTKGCLLCHCVSLALLIATFWIHP